MTKRERQGAEYAAELRQEAIEKYKRLFIEAGIALCKTKDPNAEATPDEIEALFEDAQRIALGRMAEQ